MGIVKENFGEVDDQKVDVFTLTNGAGTEAKITNYGGIITSLIVQNGAGNFIDVVLGYDTLQEYIDNNPYFGCLVGRYGNRIGKAKFVLDGEEFLLAQNDGPNHLHGGVKGFDKVVWSAREITDERGPCLELTHLSKDGDEGFPGNLQVRVLYVLTEKSELIIDYFAETDRKTIVCLTQHSYFNLAGTGNVLGHEIMIKASNYTPVDDVYIPIGDIATVASTNLDFTEFTNVGEAIASSSEDQLLEGGFDNNFVLDDPSNKLKLAAVVQEKNVGLRMEVETTEPAIQFYTGNFLDGSMTGKKGEVYYKQAGLCLEAQHFPDSPNKPDFPSVTLSPGEMYRQTTVYAFSKI